MFRDVKPGDRVWSVRRGWGVVDSVSVSVACAMAAPHVILSVVFEYGGTKEFNEKGFRKGCEYDVLPELYWDEIKFDVPQRPKRKVEKTIEGYVNIYNRNGVFTSEHLHETCERAVCNAGKDAIAKGVKVSITFEVEE